MKYLDLKFIGGLNNQKLILLGLVVSAMEQKCGLVEPLLHAYATHGLPPHNHLFSDVYDYNVFSEFLESLGVPMIRRNESDHETIEKITPVSIGPGISVLAKAFLSGKISKQDLIFRFAKALRPVESIASQAKTILDMMRSKYGGDWCAVHARPEWDFCYTQLELFIRRGPLTLDKDEDLSIISTTLLKLKLDRCMPHLHGFLLIYELDGVLAEDPRTIFNGDNVHDKSHLGPSQGGLINPMVDFEVAVNSPIYIGTARSSFASFVSITRIAHGISEDCYLFDTKSLDLQKRLDHGLTPCLRPKEAMTPIQLVD